MKEQNIIPIFSDDEKYKEYYTNVLDGLYTKDFYSHANDLSDRYSILVNCAKIYICDNYEKIKDWSKINLNIRDNKPKDSTSKQPNHGKMFFHTNRKWNSDIINKIFENMDSKPVETITDVIMDWSDGDFSLSINGLEFWWISDSVVLDIASYIEHELNK